MKTTLLVTLKMNWKMLFRKATIKKEDIIMKKALAVIMTLLLAIGNISFCLAEGSIDFSGYSLEELECVSNVSE